jgi:hypothetical protein
MQLWSEESNLYLFTPEEYEQLPDGIELACIDDEKAIKGKDFIDLDTRFGYIAYGVYYPWEHELKDLFLIFKLKE